MKLELVSSTLIPLLFAFYFILLLDTLYLFTFTWNNNKQQQQQQQQQNISLHILSACALSYIFTSCSNYTHQHIRNTVNTVCCKAYVPHVAQAALVGSSVEDSGSP